MYNGAESAFKPRKQQHSFRLYFKNNETCHGELLSPLALGRIVDFLTQKMNYPFPVDLIKANYYHIRSICLFVMCEYKKRKQ